jgi:hypothetical protein
MINMTNRPNVQVRLRALELLFRHAGSPSGLAGCGHTRRAWW